MVNRILVGGFAAALAGAAMLAISSAPAAAFTLASPSLAPPVAAGNVDHVWWDRWGRWHPNHPYGGPGWGWRPHRHCWRGPWGHVHCDY
jgi:hypothetical protein